MASVLKSGTLSLSLSDHLPVFVSWKSRSIKSKVPGHKTITFRLTKNISIDNFLSALDRVPWNTLEMFNDPSEALEQWYCLFNNVLIYTCLLKHVESKFNTNQNGFLLH